MEKEFVKSLNPPLLDVTPQGIISDLAKEFDLTTQSIRGILEGRWSRPDIVERCIELLRIEYQFMGQLLAKIPVSQSA